MILVKKPTVRVEVVTIPHGDQRGFIKRVLGVGDPIPEYYSRTVGKLTFEPVPVRFDPYDRLPLSNKKIESLIVSCDEDPDNMYELQGVIIQENTCLIDNYKIVESGIT